MKVKEYIALHPRSFLTKELLKENPKTDIIVGKGKISTHIHSNLGKAIIKVGKRYRKYVVGGKAGLHINDGYHWAVVLKNKIQTAKK